MYTLQTHLSQVMSGMCLAYAPQEATSKSFWRMESNTFILVQDIGRVLRKKIHLPKIVFTNFRDFFFFTKSQLVFQVPFLPVSSGLSLPSALRCCPLPSSFAMLRFQIGNLCAPAKLRPERSWPFHQSPHLSLSAAC